MGIIFALIAASSQAVLWVFLKKSYETLPPSVAFFFDMVFGLLIWIPFSLIVGVDFSHILQIMLYALLSAILSEAFVFFIMSKGEISYTSTIFSTYPIFTIFFSILVNKEHLDPIQWLLISIVILGTIVVSVPQKSSKLELGKKMLLLWPLLGALAVGISDTLSKTIINKTSATSFLFGLAFAQIPVSLAYLNLEKQSIDQFRNLHKKLDIYKYAILGSLLNVSTVLFLWLSFQYAPASIASPITASYPGLTILLAVIFLRDKVPIKDLFGLGMIIASIMGLGYLS